MAGERHEQSESSEPDEEESDPIQEEVHVPRFSDPARCRGGTEIASSGSGCQLH